MPDSNVFPYIEHRSLTPKVKIGVTIFPTTRSMVTFLRPFDNTCKAIDVRIFHQIGKYYCGIP